MLKIVVILAFVIIVTALVFLLLYLLKNKVGESITASAERKNVEAYLRTNPAAWEFWSTMEKWLERIEKCRKPGNHGSDPRWELYNKRLQRILELLRRIQKHIEKNPDDTARIQDVQHILPIIQNLFNGHDSYLSFGVDTAAGKEYIKSVQEGLDNVEKILEDYIDLLFQDMSSNVRVEVDAMLRWYGANKEQLDACPRSN